ncbi:MAG: hypothetical protein ACR2NS_04920 [Gemmatimonadaceae bacterium]
MISIENGSLNWRIASWTRVAPTRLGAIALLALPVLFFLPLNQVPLFPNQRAGTEAIVWLGAFGLVGVFGRDVGKPVPAWGWLFQKGNPLAEHALTTWVADLALGTAFITWWAIVWAPVMATGFADALALWAGAELTFVVGLSLVFLLNAAVGRGAVETWMGMAFIALLDPLLKALPLVVRTLIRLVIPPITDIREVGTALRAGDWGTALGSLLHPSVYVGVCLVGGAYLVSRWKPRRSD